MSLRRCSGRSSTDSWLRAVRGVGLRARESLSIRMRRAALRDHALPVRARQVAEAAGLPDPPRPPLVSVLLASRRPHLLATALANVGRQSWPRLELVLALHGAGFGDDDPVRRAAGPAMDFPHTVRLLRLDAQLPLGAVLNAASEAATGTLLAKMDDDDLYGPDHILDLVLAHGYSGAELVGKCPATVYLARPDRTVRCRRSPSETWSRSITGGTMLIARSDLLRAGGWRRAPRHVDRALVDDVLSAGGAVYRTHDEGYVPDPSGRRPLLGGRRRPFPRPGGGGAPGLASRTRGDPDGYRHRAVAAGPGMRRPAVSARPAVSVILPARNAEATLPATLDSILSQDYPGGIEVIVADGSETAATADLLRARYPQVLRVDNPDRGISAGPQPGAGRRAPSGRAALRRPCGAAARLHRAGC